MQENRAVQMPEHHQAVLLKLGGIEAKLDNALEKLKDHEDRIRLHEKFRAAYTSITAAVGAVVGTVITVGAQFLPPLFGKH